MEDIAQRPTELESVMAEYPGLLEELCADLPTGGVHLRNFVEWYNFIGTVLNLISLCMMYHLSLSKQ